MTSVAVVAHNQKTLGAGLPALRSALVAAGVSALWYEIDKSRKAPKRVREALAAGADRILVWGGDGTVQRVVNAAAGSEATVGILPAGTANLLATNLGIPSDLDEALDIALNGELRQLDLGVVNGERFAVMAGTGFDAAMINEADRNLKDRVGQLAYVWTGFKAAARAPQRARIRVDGHSWFKGKAGCILIANVPKIGAGVRVFDNAKPDDGWLELGVVTAATRAQWARVMAAVVAGNPNRSKFVRTTTCSKVDIRLDRKARYELDGGSRKPTKRMRVRVEPESINVCVPVSQ